MVNMVILTGAIQAANREQLEGLSIEILKKMRDLHVELYKRGVLIDLNDITNLSFDILMGAGE